MRLREVKNSLSMSFDISEICKFLKTYIAFSFQDLYKRTNDNSIYLEKFNFSNTF